MFIYLFYNVSKAGNAATRRSSRGAARPTHAPEAATGLHFCPAANKTLHSRS